MGKPLMIQPEDDEKIENLKERTGARTKVEVLRAGLRLLEAETERQERVARWKKVVKAVSGQSAEVNRDFRGLSRLKRS